MPDTATPTETGQMCPHRRTQLATAQTELAGAAKVAARAREGSQRYAKAIAAIQARKKDIADFHEHVRVYGKVCEFCRERANADPA